MSLLDALRQHWPEYLMEAWGLGVFMVSAGVLLLVPILGASFIDLPVSLVVTVPGTGGDGLAFVAEFIISAALMLAVLYFNSHRRLQAFTGVAAGVLVALFILFEAPISGMSINPARSFASAAPGGIWTAAWIYYTAPVFGMLTAAEGFRLFLKRQTHCAKLIHTREKRCIHCGHQAVPSR